MRIRLTTLFMLLCTLAWGWSLQHIENISLKNIKMTLKNPDERQMMYQKNVKNLIQL